MNLNDAPGYLVVALLMTSLIVTIMVLFRFLKATRLLTKELQDGRKILELVPEQTAPTAWLPAYVALIANVFRISPAEVENEYRKEPDARKWIVSNIFPDNDLTKKMIRGQFRSRFIAVGYDFKTNEETISAATIAKNGREFKAQ